MWLIQTQPNHSPVTQPPSSPKTTLTVILFLLKTSTTDQSFTPPISTQTHTHQTSLPSLKRESYTYLRANWGKPRSPHRRQWSPGPCRASCFGRVKATSEQEEGISPGRVLLGFYTFLYSVLEAFHSWLDGGKKRNKEEFGEDLHELLKNAPRRKLRKLTRSQPDNGNWAKRKSDQFLCKSQCTAHCD